MKLLYRLLLLLALAKYTSSCAPLRHDAQAPGSVRHRYHRVQRHNERRRRRFVPPQLPWSSLDLRRVRRLDSATARNWAAPTYLFQF